MKTLKLKIAGLKLQLKKIFFNHGNLTINKYKESIAQENLSHVNEVEKMRFDEYIKVYKSTTRWQTV
jgi:hypothetical protein